MCNEILDEHLLAKVSSGDEHFWELSKPPLSCPERMSTCLVGVVGLDVHHVEDGYVASKNIPIALSLM